MPKLKKSPFKMDKSSNKKQIKNKVNNDTFVGLLFASAKVSTHIVRHPRLAGRYFKLNRKNNSKLKKGTTGSYYINTRLQNIAVYGMTRSGKGQMIILPMIDLNSRASIKHNMMVTDPKLEIMSATYKMLKERGFNVHVLNLLNLMKSSSYNPLSAVIKPASMGDIETATNVCTELAATIYIGDGNNKGPNQYFYNSAANLFTAIVFGLLTIAHGDYYADGHPELSFNDQEDKNAYDKVTMYNVVQFITNLGGTQIAKLDGSNDSKINIFFDHLTNKLDELRAISQVRRLDDVELDQLNLLNQAKISYGQTKLASSDAAGNIFSTFTDGLSIYKQPEVAKMTSLNSLNPLTLGFDHLITLQFDRGFAQQDVKIATYSAVRDENNNLVPSEKIEEQAMQLSSVGGAEIPLEKSIPGNEYFIKASIHNEKIQANQDFKWTIKGTKKFYSYEDYSIMVYNNEQKPLTSDMQVIEDEEHNKKIIDKYTKEPMFKGMSMEIIEEPHRSSFLEERIGKDELNFLSDEKRKLRSLKPESLEFLYDEKPTVLFLATPPDKIVLNQLATFFINQTINTLSGYALRKTKGRSMQRALQIIFDELGNLPKIPKLQTKVSFALSQLLSFVLILQDKEQLINLYGRESADTILSNCGTTNYILSKSQKTAEEISNAVGKRTVQVRNANTDEKNVLGFGKVKSGNTTSMAQTILPVTRLRNLKEGEMVILRSTDRRNNLGEDVSPLPIFNTGENILPYAWWFLNESLSDMSVNDIPIVTPHKYLSLEDTIFDYNKIYQNMEKQKVMDISNIENISSNLKDKINKLDTSDEAKEKIIAKVNDITESGLNGDISVNSILPKLNKMDNELSNNSYKQIQKLTILTKRLFDRVKDKQAKMLDVLSQNHPESNFDGLVEYIKQARYEFDSRYKDIINNSKLGEAEYARQLSTLIYANNQAVNDYDTLHQNAILVINQAVRTFLMNSNILQSKNIIKDDGKGNKQKLISVTLTKFGEYLINNYSALATQYSSIFHDLIDDNLPDLDPNIIMQYILEVISLYTNGIEIDEDGEKHNISMSNVFEDERKDDAESGHLLGYDLFLVIINRDLMSTFATQGNQKLDDISFTNYFSYITGILDKLITFAKAKTRNIDNDDIDNIQVSKNHAQMIDLLVRMNDLTTINS
ncbi:hypothetical protein DY052_06015 [Apilactobacillus timberlakei]|uniref:type IV secretory system conjugative DNA transfer family protein n=1 Tax=Apilactobacillus timberlakei TaxID=2008380 RepID=UPI001127B363|nr:type IV secretory system conjugative DNA transfer family protein [Apilactobacillus timberlakei]TPR14979.1 hypothetical protein DY052_06015 [Apilactobacillus timberlakei]